MLITPTQKNMNNGAYLLKAFIFIKSLILMMNTFNKWLHLEKVNFNNSY